MPQVIDLEKQLREWNFHREAIFDRLDKSANGRETAKMCNPYRMVALFSQGQVHGMGRFSLETSKIYVWHRDTTLATMLTSIARETYSIGYEFSVQLKGMEFHTGTALSEAVIIHLFSYFAGQEEANMYSKIIEPES